MKKGILSLLAWSLPFLSPAQNNASPFWQDSGLAQANMQGEKGIKWTTGLSWEQVKQKAKAEKKYIFIDAYTTWCGPCKAMDKYIYPNDTVGIFFNEYFISIKAQMDVTDKDDQSIKDWYNDATAIRTEYMVVAYPSLIFLSPQGKILQKEEGYRSKEKLIAIGKEILTPGKTYEDPFKEYKKLVSEYKQGIKHYDSMPYMIRTAGKLNDNDLAREMFKDHLNYVSTLNENERYTKQNIELWFSILLKVDSKALQFFIKDSIKIDQVVGQKGFSTMAIDKTIQGRIVDSFFRIQKGETTIITGKKVPNSEIMFMWLPTREDGKIEPDYVEADWKKLKKMISKHFSQDYVARNVFTAKISWYWKHQNMEGVAKTYFSQLAKYPPIDLVKEYDMINEICWQTFLYSNDRKLLQKALAWMDKIIQQGANQPNKIDTYANLLYKLGQTNEAIEWEEKAYNIRISKGEGIDNTYKNVIEKMKKGEPTYLKKGAIWPKDK